MASDSLLDDPHGYDYNGYYYDHSYNDYDGQDYTHSDKLGLNMSNTTLGHVHYCHLLMLSLINMTEPDISFAGEMNQENCSDYLNHLYEYYPEYGLHNSTMHHDLPTYIRFYLLAIIIPIGLLFNLLSCAVFLQSRMQKSSTVFYFFALACADNFVLLGELLDWLNTATSTGRITGLNFVDSIDSACRFVYFLRYFGRLFSSWLVVTICIERFITVAYPLRSAWSSTPKKAMMLICGITVVCMILSCPPFFMYATKYFQEYNRDACIILFRYESAYEIWISCIIIIGELVIPSIIVIIFTTLIIIKLKKARLRRMLSKEGQGKGQQNRRDNQPTIALLAVSIAFVTLRTPYIIMYPLHWRQHIVFAHHTHSQKGQFLMAVQITYVLAVANYAVNFLLYIITGKKFRNEFVKFLLCKKAKFSHTWSRSSRSHSISSQMTTLRRFSNGEVLQSQSHRPVPTDKSSSSCQDTQL